jgi:acyl carrier protein
MLPAAYVVLDQLPLTANGKVDRQALAQMERPVDQTSAYVAPVGDYEQEIADIWQALLGIERVGRSDNFFEIGGHSLLLMRLVGQLRDAFAVELSPATVFEHPRLSELASMVRTLQLTQYLKEDVAQMEVELDGLSDDELLELLRQESVHE